MSLNLWTALKAPFNKTLFGSVYGGSGADIAVDNDFQDYAFNPSSTAIPTVKMGRASDGATLVNNPVGLMVHNAFGLGMKTVTFNLAANGSLGTQTFFIADSTYTITSISYVHKTQGTGAAVANVTKDTGTTAPGAGVTLQNGTFDCVGTANNTVLTGTLTSTAANLKMAVGDRLAIAFTGTLTTLAGVTVTVTMGPNCVTDTAVYFCNVNADIKTQSFYVANRDRTITGVKLIYKTPFAAAVTVDVTKDTGTAAAGAGTSILSAAMAGDGTANTLITPTLAATATTLKMAAGDRLAVKFSATTTGVGVCLIVTFAPIFTEMSPTWQLALNAQEQVAQTFFIADRAYEVVDASCVFDVAAGGASKLAVTIDKGTTAPGSGNVVQTDNTNAGFDLNATARTVQFMTPATRHLRMLSAGDRLGLSPTGAAQTSSLVAITVQLIPK